EYHCGSHVDSNTHVLF
nr:immunoglobulin light chain junction region [Macaca mulatta]